MNINIYLPVKKIEKNHKEAFAEYQKRLSRYCSINLKPLKDYATYASHINENNSTIFVTPGKDTISSPAFSDYIAHEFSKTSNLDFFICSKDVDPATLLSTIKKQDMVQIFSISCFDMNEELSAVVLAEQIYRAYTIQNNIAYHK